MTDQLTRIGDHVFILMISPGQNLFDRGRVVGEVIVVWISDDGSLGVEPISGHGHKTPWSKTLGEFWLTKSEAQKALEKEEDSRLSDLVGVQPMLGHENPIFYIEYRHG